MNEEKSLEDRFLDALDSNACNDCGEYKSDVEYTTCPYEEEINNKQIWVWLCSDCCRERCRDI